MTSSNGMEDYYQKVIQLQERLRHSEEERLKLEMKFNEMLQVMKEEEEVHFKKLRTKYKQFLEEDRRRQHRNDKILEALDRIENRAQIWEAKTEKFKVFRRKYQDYLKHAGGRRSRSPLDVERPPDPKHDSYETGPLLSEKKPERDSEDVRNDIMEKYLQSLSSQKCKEDILQRKNNEIPPPESKYSNLGNINSMYWKNPKSGEKTDPEKEDDSTQLKNTKDLENALKQNSSAPAPLSRSYGYAGGDTSYDDLPSFARKPLLDNDYGEISSLGRKSSGEPENKEYKFSSNVSVYDQKPFGNEISRRTSQQLTDYPIQGKGFVKPEQPPHAEQVHNELERMLKQHKDEAQSPSFQTKNEPLPKLPPMNIQPTQKEQYQSTPKEQYQSTPKEQYQSMPKEQYQAMPKEQYQSIPKQQFQPVPKEYIQPMPKQPIEVPSRHDMPKPLDQSPGKIEKIGDVLKSDQTLINSKVSAGSRILDSQPLEQPIEGGIGKEPLAQVQRRPSEALKSEFDMIQGQKEIPETAAKENVQLEKKDLGQRNDADQKVDGSQSEQPQQPSDGQEQLDQPLQQDLPDQPTLEKQSDFGEHAGQPPGQHYDANGQPLQPYDSNGQVPQEYNENGQYLQQYYDENGQPLQQYDQNGQPLQQYDENGQPLQQYDESGQPLQQYDESGQPLQQQYYDESGQLQSQYYDQTASALPQYDENGQPIPQYDETGQPIPQYDETGQAIPQYNETGQAIPQYDENGQLVTQYDENGQPLTQYDPNTQVQYDENGQPVAQYDENGQPIVQYDQPLTQYDENGQPLQQYYDETGQPIQYYGEGESAHAQQFDENGQPIQQQYSEQPYEEPQQYYDQQQDPGQQQEEQPKTEAKSNILEMLETDTESAKQDTKISNDSDFDFSNG